MTLCSNRPAMIYIIKQFERLERFELKPLGAANG
jgi:hypothetical protein